MLRPPGGVPARGSDDQPDPRVLGDASQDREQSLPHLVATDTGGLGTDIDRGDHAPGLRERACVDGEHKVVLRGRAEVLDGDTIVLDGERVRFVGLDAPEGDQWCEAEGRRWSCGDASTAALVELIAGREVECRAPDRDRFGRPLAICRAGGIDLNREIMRLG